MKKIYIEGNFIIKGDIPTLDMLQQPMSTAYIEVEEHCPIKLVQFECPKENLTKHNKDLTKKCLRCNDEGVLPIVDGNGKKVGERYCQDCSGISSSES